MVARQGGSPQYDLVPVKMFVRRCYLVFDVDAVQAVEVRLVAVLVPPASSVRHGAAGDEGRRVAVSGGEDYVVVITEGVAWKHEERGDESNRWF